MIAGSHEGTRPPTHSTSRAAGRELDSARSFDMVWGSSQEIIPRQNQVFTPHQSLPIDGKIPQLCQMTWLKQRAVLFNSGPHKVRGRFEPAGMSPNAAERQMNISPRVDFDSRCEILSPSCFKLSYVGHGNVGLQVVYLPPPPQPRLTRAVYYEAPVPAPRE